VVTSQAAENSLSNFHRLGSQYDIQEDKKFFAVWAIDKDNNGSPDYNNAVVEKRSQLRILSEDQTDQTAPQLEAAAIRVWAHEGVLYIESDRRTRAEVYTRSGALYKRIDVAEGQTREPLAEGFYVVVIDGKTHKVIVK